MKRHAKICYVYRAAFDQFTKCGQEVCKIMASAYTLVDVKDAATKLRDHALSLARGDSNAANTIVRNVLKRFCDKRFPTCNDLAPDQYEAFIKACGELLQEVECLTKRGENN